MKGFSVKPDEVLIKGGTYTRGSPEEEEGRFANEVQREATVRDLYVAVTPVTQELYFAVTGERPSRFSGAPDLPVEQVSWSDAVRFCNRLSEMNGLDPVYIIDGEDVTVNRKASGYRLPTEDEWEYACRAGTTGPTYDDRPLVDLAWYSGNSEGKTHPVGEKAPNPWGLYDMLGNVWEWTEDEYEG